MDPERMPVDVFPDASAACRTVAERVAELVRRCGAQHRPAVLGVTAGHTTLNVYRELIRMHADGGLDLSGTVVFQFDEYWPMQADSLQSRRRWLRENFLHHVNVPPASVHVLDGQLGEQDVDAFCRRYEQAVAAAGGIDLQLLDISNHGHIGFNEPACPPEARTRRVRLDKATRMDAASDFFGEQYVPAHALTMGVATALAARTVCLLAFGEHKAPILRRVIEEPVTPQLAVGCLQDHPDATAYVDAAAGAMLTRQATPWLLGPCQWDDAMARRAVIWLALKLGKAVLALTDEDYAENGLYELLAARGRAYETNLSVFRRMMQTITGWPGGRDPGKRIVVFSPHPDDDVISMGATLQRLCGQGHEVHAVYQTSGNIAVFDHAVLRYAEFLTEFNSIFGLAAEATARIDAHIEQFLRNKTPGSIDSAEVQAVKTLIRKTEAIAAATYCGVPAERCHFLEMPFYRTGTVQKRPIGAEDVALVREVLAAVRPDIVFAAGDLSDPHGTHRMCLEAVLRALADCPQAGGGPVVWLYRGAWQEWEPHQIDMAVPISPDELYHKRHAIFRHESQKDRAMFPGAYDTREFWQRAEDRNRATAGLYDRLGLPQYCGMEAFVRHRPGP